MPERVPRRCFRRLRLERLERRLAPSLTLGQGEACGHAVEQRLDKDAANGNPTPIDLFAVALHEFGHKLGLSHSSANDGINAAMDPFYRGPVSEGLHSQDIQRIQALYPESGANPGGFRWADPNITVSFTKDWARMEGLGQDGREGGWWEQADQDDEQGDWIAGNLEADSLRCLSAMGRRLDLGRPQRKTGITPRIPRILLTSRQEALES
jgi:hypothetical protein